MSHCLFLFVYMTLAYTAVSQDVVYPKSEEADYLSGNNPVINERIPVYIPNRCPENMLLFPGEGDKSTWMCDCKPGFLYFPLNSSCHAAYSQGPCASGSFVYLPPGEVVPVCMENPCPQNDISSGSHRVPFEGKCYALGSFDESPCGRGSPLRVNATTFQLECDVPPIIIKPFLVEAPETTCAPGSRKIKGVCRTPI